MQTPQKQNPPGQTAGFAGAVLKGLPRNSSEVTARLQRRVSGFALVMDVVCRDVEALQEMASTLATGYGLTDAERHELARIAFRLFDAREVLG